MPISAEEFERLPLLGSQAPVEARALALLQASEAAYTAREVAAALMGIQGGFSLLLSPEIDQVLPSVTAALQSLTRDGKIRSRVKHTMAGPETYYQRLPGHSG